MNEFLITIKFSIPVNSRRVFDFIVRPENMPLYQGYILVPGIKNVRSSDIVRKVGTVDEVFNNDGSKHFSRTEILEPGVRYSLKLYDIQITGIKKYLANPINGFKEDWLFKDKNQVSQVERRLYVYSKKGLLNTLLMKCLILPLLERSLVLHHRNLLKSSLL